MDRSSSPVSHGDSIAASSPTSSTGPEEQKANVDEAAAVAAAVAAARKRKISRKKRLPTTTRTPKVAATASSSNNNHHNSSSQPHHDDESDAPGPTTTTTTTTTTTSSGNPASGEPHVRKLKKPKKRKDKEADGRPVKKPRKQQQPRVKMAPVEGGLTTAQMAVNEQMRKALEEDQYSANGSIVDTESDDEDLQFTYKGQPVRLDRAYLAQAARKHLWLERAAAGATSSAAPLASTNSSISALASGGANKDSASSSADGDDADGRRSRGNKKKKKGKRGGKEDDRGVSPKPGQTDGVGSNVIAGASSSGDNDFERDEGSIFGQTTGSSNSTWVECDKCKKWRRLRGVVDERKLPPKWYCSMNKNDPERSRCSAPEEEYDASSTPESAADARTRKHLRVWVRRLQCNEAYEARQPTLTRGKKRATTTSAKDPYEWIRCCNPSCGKWRVILRSMDAKSNVIDRATDGEWYCVMNTWDEKTASCAAPQENLPAVGCPPWVIQGDN